MIMENSLFCASLPITDQNPMALDDTSSHVFSGSLVQSNTLGNNSQRPTMACYPWFSTLQEEAISNLHISNHDSMANSAMPVSRNMPLSCNSSGNADIQEHLIENSLSVSSFANLLCGSTGFVENIIPETIPSVSVLPSDEIRTYIPYNSCSTSNSLFPASVNCAYGAEDDINFLASRRYFNMNGQLNSSRHYDEIVECQVPGRKITTVRPSYHVISGCDAAWISNKSTLNSSESCTYSVPSNELSLTLGSIQPPGMNMPSIPDHMPEISCSSITQVTSKDNRYPDATELQVCSHIFWNPANNFSLGSREFFPRNRELSLSCGSPGRIHFSRVLLGSRYMHVAQHVLTEVASYALENLNEPDESSARIGSEPRLSFSSSCSGEKGASSMSSEEFSQSSDEIRSQGHMESPFQRAESKSKKTELISMLQMVCSRSFFLYILSFEFHVHGSSDYLFPQ
uniref:Homeobox protein ATH1 n=1 Tax=Anthurium amnicola TaxID=1678845 RepID=A0A1D1XLV1_9ARAE